LAELIDDGGKRYHDEYNDERRKVTQQFKDNAFDGAIVLSDEGNYWAYHGFFGPSEFGNGYWQRLGQFHVWFLKLVGRIK